MKNIRIKRLLILVFLLVIFVLGFIILITVLGKKVKNNEEEIPNKEYNITITVPNTNNEFINNTINKETTTKTDEFKKNVDDEEYDEKTSSINIEYQINNLDNIYSIYKIETLTINEKETITKEFKYLNNTTQEEIELEKLYTNEEDFYTKLIWYMNWYINRSSNTINYTNKNAINDKNNYYIIFKKNNIDILFKENTLLKEETIIPCPYTALSTYLNTEILNLNAVEIDKIENKDDEYYKTKKLVAFTFDDGPNPDNTNLLLDELEKRNYKVTFFVVGYKANNNKDTIKREYELGHTIGNHTWAHKYLQQFKNDIAGMQESVTSVNDLLKEITGQETTFFRPPGGIRNQTILNAIDMPFILWTVDTRDWEKRNTELDAIAAVENTKKQGDIILFHDAHAPSIPGAIQAMDILAYDNYEFVNLDTLVRLQGVTLEKHNLYWSIR